MTNSIITNAISEYLLNQVFYESGVQWRTGIDESSYGDSLTLDEKEGYRFYHFSGNDALFKPDHPLAKILVQGARRYRQEIYQNPKLSCLKNIKLGDLLIRLVEYQDHSKLVNCEYPYEDLVTETGTDYTSISFGSHTDIDLLAIPLASFNNRNDIKLPKGFYVGEQVRLLPLNQHQLKPTPHRFNGGKKRYSIIFFANAHFSEYTRDKKTIGDFLLHNYYR